MKPDPQAVIEPWLSSFESRKQVFDEAKNKGKKIALYFVKGPDSSTFRYRCYNTFSATKASKTWQAVYFYHSEVKAVKELLKDAQIIILGRQSRWGSLVSDIISSAHKHGLKVMFDLDDLVFDKKYIPIVLNTISETNADYWVPYFSDIGLTAEHCDGFVVTNEFLGGRLKMRFNKPYQVIMNSLNAEQLTASRIYVARKPLRHDKKFVIGYFSGSPTHANDLEVALPEVLSFLKNHNDATLRVVGLMDFPESAKPFLANGQIEFIPPVDYRKLQRRMSEVDVNLAPLVDNEFTNCKSELKFFEAAVVETTTIASPTFAFKKAIKEGKTGFLARPGEWYDKLEYLYSHPEENRKIALNAKEYCLENYYGEKFLRQVEGAYDALLK